jgi:hypothetical protein
MGKAEIVAGFASAVVTTYSGNGRYRVKVHVLPDRIMTKVVSPGGGMYLIDRHREAVNEVLRQLALRADYYVEYTVQLPTADGKSAQYAHILKKA